ncbi:MAG: dienelactone hydrolase family protein [Proteobacteria bacterium]|nr:dienelactone hydrolase family protein [Pseudomonadota bacterium]
MPEFAKTKAVTVCRRTVQVPLDTDCLVGDLSIPEGAKGIVLFAHGSGSSRLSPRNRQVAELLNEHAFATLLADLLTTEEGSIDQETRHLRFDIPLLAERLEKITQWTKDNADTARFTVGYFGASTGAAAALVAAARCPDVVKAIVSRGGRPDLAGEFLPRVTAPTLLIVGGHDSEVLSLNKKALQKLNTHSVLRIIPRATHLFEEPGALEAASQMAAEWFDEHIG